MLPILIIIVKKRRLIALVTGSVTFLAIILSFLLPKTFRASTTILPPESSGDFSGLLGLTTGQIAQAVTNFALPVMATPSDLYATMIESQRILGSVVDSLDLARIYGTKTHLSAIANLKNDVTTIVERDGIIRVDVDAHDPLLAAQIANLLVYNLDQVNRSLQNTRGHDFRIFLEKRLLEAHADLAKSQEAMRTFQQDNRAVSISLQAQALIDNLAEQKAHLTSAEIELEVLKKILMPGHPDLLQKQMLVNEIRSKLRQIEGDPHSPADSVLTALDIPLSRIPDLSLQFAILTRNAKIHEMTYELLSQQLEMAKLQERRDTPSLSVLDTAVPPENPIKPSKKLVVISALLLTFALTSALVVASEALRRERDEQSATLLSLENLWQEFKKQPLG